MQVSRFSTIVGLVGALAVASVGGMMVAQAQGGGVAIDASGSFEVSGVLVDVKGKDAETARLGGWRLAQRKGWEMLSLRLTGKKSSLPDGTLDALSAGIVVEREQIGPDRYIARLGVLFDRARAGAILGVSTQVSRSSPMLLVPLEFSGGVGRVFERETAWTRAWNRFRSGGSTIDYVRLNGTGPDALLVNAGQTLRRGRNWWRTVLDQYGASDVLVAEVQLRREYPGGPVIGIFAANHGPDRKPITSFALRVDNGDSLDALLDAGIQRIDAAYQRALAGGLLRTDAILATRPPKVKTEAEKRAEAEAAAAAAAAGAIEPEAPTPLPTSVSTASYTIHVDTPNVSTLTASESAVRGVPGVRSSTTTSLALGGISVIRVSYDGSIAGLRSALEARGWQVQEGVGVLRIRRGGAGAAPVPQPAPGSPSAATGE